MRFGFLATRKQSQLVSIFQIISPNPHRDIQSDAFDVDVDGTEQGLELERKEGAGPCRPRLCPNPVRRGQRYDQRIPGG